MTARARLWSAGIAAALLLFMVVLMFQGPRRVFAASGDGLDVHVTCASVLIVGWPGDHDFLSAADSSAWSDHVTTQGADYDTVGRQGIANGCSDARTTRLGLLILLAMPTTVLASAALRPTGRPVRQVVPVPSRAWTR